MTFISIYKVIFKDKFKVKGRGTGYRPEITSGRAPKWSQTIASLPEQLVQPRPLNLHLTFKIKYKVKGPGTGYRPAITPARVPKWSQPIASLPEQLIQPWPLTLRLTFDLALHLTFWKVWKEVSTYRYALQNLTGILNILAFWISWTFVSLVNLFRRS